MEARWCGCLVVLVALAGCAGESSGEGEACQRSTQCDPGLACVEGVCSGDLSAIVDESEVPELMPEPEDAGMDAGAQDGAPPPPDPDQDAG